MLIEPLINFFKKVQKQKEQNPFVFTSLTDIRNAFVNENIVASDAIELEFKDPRKIGILDQSGNNTTLTRFNPQEFENRVIKGIVSRVWKEDGLLNQWIIEVSTQIKIEQSTTVPRNMVLLDNEIAWIRKLQ